MLGIHDSLRADLNKIFKKKKAVEAEEQKPIVNSSSFINRE